MKCDELEKFDATSNADRSAGIESRYAYDADEVDEAIEELKAMVTTDNSAVIARLEAENAELKEKLESVKATAYTESVDAGMALRKTKRALWMARKAHAVAMFAYWDSHYRDNPNAVYRNRTVDWLRNRWLLILDCCIKKEKECEFTVATKFCPMCGRKLTDAK